MQQHWKGLGSHGTVGLELVVGVVLGVLGGQWLDKKLGTTPWLMILGLAFGIAAGVRALYRALQRANRESEELDRKQAQDRKKYDDDSQRQP